MKPTVTASELESLISEAFDVDVSIKRFILPLVDVGRTAQAAVFMASNNQLLLYLRASSNMTLADVKKIAVRMGLRLDEFYPPKYQPDYFDILGRQKFQEVFPGMTVQSEEDLIFYRTLAPYNPALAVVSEIKHGEIHQFDPDVHGEWRVGARFAYRKVRAK
jgi:hypothetical protein cdiviTM7_00910